MTPHRPGSPVDSDAEGESLGDSGPALKRHQLSFFRDLIYREAGIFLRESKQTMLAARLSRRLRALGLADFSEYVDYLSDADIDRNELRELINVVTTNKTSFFREAHHFDFLRDVLIPAVRDRAARGGPRRLRIWSAGCSTGEEPYSIAMTLAEHLGPLAAWDVSITASDIDTRVLATASEGIYAEDRMDGIPEALRRRYFQRGKNGSAGSWRVRPDLKALVEFRHVNLNHTPWPVTPGFDAIFCRNVIIYFDQVTQERLFERFAAHLDPDGYLFLGHSESLIGVSDRFALIKNTVHRLRADKGGARPRPTAAAQPAAPAPGLPEKRLIAGDVFASRTPTLGRTLLGSCISACLFDPEARVGGLNHFLLPAGEESGPRGARYGVHAMELLINEIMKLGGARHRLVAKAFGGAHVVSSMSTSVPAGNVTFIREFLQRENIPLVGERLGGETAMEVCFETATGRARVRRLPAAPMALLTQQEAMRRRLAAELQAAGDDRVVLF